MSVHFFFLSQTSFFHRIGERAEPGKAVRTADYPKGQMVHILALGIAVRTALGDLASSGVITSS